MQVIAFLIIYFSDDLRNTYMLQVFLRYFASYIRVHPSDLICAIHILVTFSFLAMKKNFPSKVVTVS